MTLSARALTRRILSERLRRIELGLIGQALVNLYVGTYPLFDNSWARSLLDDSLPDNPLSGFKDPLPVEILFIAAPKDFDILPLSITAALRNVSNPISSVTVIVPDSARKKLAGLPATVRVLVESESPHSADIEKVKHHFGKPRSGWVLQQGLGLAYCLNSSSQGILWIDADTVLLRPKTFLVSGPIQTLSMSREMHKEYENHARRRWPIRPKLRGLSFVTHFQLFQPRIVREMFPSGIKDVIEWIVAGNQGINSPISEYHCHGRFISTMRPEEVELARWGNKSVPRELFRNFASPDIALDELVALFPDYLSISMHRRSRKSISG